MYTQNCCLSLSCWPTLLTKSHCFVVVFVVLLCRCIKLFSLIFIDRWVRTAHVCVYYNLQISTFIHFVWFTRRPVCPLPLAIHTPVSGSHSAVARKVFFSCSLYAFWIVCCSHSHWIKYGHIKVSVSFYFYRVANWFSASSSSSFFPVCFRYKSSVAKYFTFVVYSPIIRF